MIDQSLIEQLSNAIDEIVVRQTDGKAGAKFILKIVRADLMARLEAIKMIAGDADALTIHNKALDKAIAIVRGGV